MFAQRDALKSAVRGFFGTPAQHTIPQPINHSAGVTNSGPAAARRPDHGARRCPHPLIVFKATLPVCKTEGFTQTPRLPMVSFGIDHPISEAFMPRVLSRPTRKDFNVKFRRAAEVGPIALSVVYDSAPDIDEVRPLYLQVCERARLRVARVIKGYCAGWGDAVARCRHLGRG
jgi:hypothetical protein